MVTDERLEELRKLIYDLITKYRQGEIRPYQVVDQVITEVKEIYEKHTI